MNTTPSRLNILDNEILKMIQNTTNRSVQNKKKSFRIYIGIAISSALITFLVAVSNDLPKNLNTPAKFLTLFFSALTTVLASWDGFYNHKQLWVNYSETRDLLKELHLKIKLVSKEDENNPEFINYMHKEFQNIVSKSNYKWKELRLDDRN